MTPAELRARILPLDPDTPLHRHLEHELRIGVGYGSAWYRSQKEHWLGWLATYTGPGVYGRTPRNDRTAQFVYNRIQCAPMLFWLAEATGVPQGPLGRAYGAVRAASKHPASQCRALRRVIPWEMVAEHLERVATRCNA